MDMVEDMKLILDPIAQNFRFSINANAGIESELAAAARRGDIDSVRKFLEKRAEVDTRDSRGRTALMGAASNGHSEVVKILLDSRG